jgi:hypothetical protein
MFLVMDQFINQLLFPTSKLVEELYVPPEILKLCSAVTL